ncbi:TIGR03089 family protein [Actinocrinis sp.]|uniref:TIGR03089 family protein n=1 Tax=Actinocrinis sp. TaxID=1920516 RepID=UPI002D3050F7|nr:TIGR03089 family protein [Actinocrinis sp.]HZP50959.1 TIGR03089 family protein [Actinocrinis sp.]
MTIPSSGGDQRGLAGARDIASAWQRLIATKAAQPFLTYHDDTTGERVELSYATFGNWLAKTANLVQDDLLAGPGDRIVVSARPHWLTAVWLVAPLLAGAVVDPWGEAKSAHTVVAGPDEQALAAARECPGERLALSLLPLGRPFDVVPDGFRDYSAEVRAFGDRFASFNPPRPDMDALVLDGETVTHGELIERAAGWEGTGRLLVDVRQDRFTGDALLSWLFGPLLTGTAIVLVRGAGPERLDRIAEMERTTGRFTLG